jgi:YD repeat-containing protein
MANPNSEALDKTLAKPADHSPSALLLADARAHANSREIKVSSGDFSRVNVSQEKTSSGTVTRFPNGVKFCTDNNVSTLAPPPGGSIGGGEHGGMVAYDSKHRPVAELENGMLRVQTKNGEYTENQAGNVTFKPSGDAADLRTLHKPGHVPAAKLENYGVSTDGAVTRFPNGIEFNSHSNKITVPADYPNFRETTTKNADGSATRQGFDANGKLLYSADDTSIKVPTSDGTLTQNTSGAVSFETASSTKHISQKVLPQVELFSTKPSEDDCMKSKDPICGLDLGKF